MGSFDVQHINLW